MYDPQQRAALRYWAQRRLTERSIPGGLLDGDDLLQLVVEAVIKRNGRRACLDTDAEHAETCTASIDHARHYALQALNRRADTAFRRLGRPRRLIDPIEDAVNTEAMLSHDVTPVEDRSSEVLIEAIDAALGGSNREYAMWGASRLALRADADQILVALRDLARGAHQLRIPAAVATSGPTVQLVFSIGTTLQWRRRSEADLVGRSDDAAKQHRSRQSAPFCEPLFWALSPAEIRPDFADRLRLDFRAGADLVLSPFEAMWRPARLR